MKSYYFYFLVCFGMGCTSLAQVPPRAEFYRVQNQKEMAPGVIWTQLKENDVFGNRQEINILEIDLLKSKVRPMATASCEKVSKLGASEGAIAGVNGTFYASDCSSRNFLKVNGKTYSKNEIRKEGSVALLISKDNKARFQWLQHDEDPEDAFHGIGGFPQLLNGGKIQITPNENTSFFNGRHPRTSVGLKSSHEVVIVTVDGRSNKSKGFTILELAQFLKELGVVDAMNLDGGVSTVMWLDSEGVVNTPSSSSGEKRVTDALGVF